MRRKYPGVDGIIGSLGLKKKDSVLILADDLSDMTPIEVLRQGMAATCSEICIEMLPTTLQEDFPADISRRWMDVDVIFLAASQSWYQAPARRSAKHRYGKRVVECYGMKLEMLKTGAMCADLEKLADVTKLFMENFSSSSRACITTASGTNFSADYEHVFEENGRYAGAGTGGNLPAGEISLGLVDGSANGLLNFDISFDGIGRLEKNALQVTIHKGRVSDVKGKSKDVLNSLLMENSTLINVAEIGIGTNSSAVFGRSVLEDEKKLGTVHIGFGNDTYFGGKVDGPHFDGVLNAPSITINEKPFMANGMPVSADR